AVRKMPIHTGTAKFDLTLVLTETPSGLHGELEYSTDLFDGATTARMVGHFQTLLEGIAADPDRRLSELPLLTEGERQQLLLDLSQGQRLPTQNETIPQLVEAQV